MANRRKVIFEAVSNSRPHHHSVRERQKPERCPRGVIGTIAQVAYQSNSIPFGTMMTGAPMSALSANA